MNVCPACGSATVRADLVCDDCGTSPAIIDGFPAYAPDLAYESAGFKGAYFADLADVEGQSFWFGARNELIVWAMRRYAPECRRFLEIGCGTGFVLSRIRSAFPDAELAGSEILSAGLPFAAARVPSASFYQMDARAIPFRDHFDVVGAFDVLEHILDDRAVIAEVRRALRPGGIFLASVPQHPWLWSPQDDRAFHVRRYTAPELRSKLVAAGFEIVRMTSFVSLLLPALFASRLAMRRQKADETFDAIATLRKPRLVDAALAAVMAGERAAIRAGLSFPAGGSLLVVARRAEVGS